MDLEFTEEQQLIKDMTRSMLAEHSPIEVVRVLEDNAELREKMEPLIFAGSRRLWKLTSAGMRRLHQVMWC